MNTRMSGNINIRANRMAIQTKIQTASSFIHQALISFPGSEPFNNHQVGSSVIGAAVGSIIAIIIVIAAIIVVLIILRNKGKMCLLLFYSF